MDSVERNVKENSDNIVILQQRTERFITDQKTYNDWLQGKIFNLMQQEEPYSKRNKN
jgi:hypothetical protein